MKDELPKNIEDIYPMTDIEKGMVFHYLKNTRAAHYHDQLVYILMESDFEAERFKKAAVLMVDKHPILRTGFYLEDFEEPVQIVQKEVPLDIRHYDISKLTTLEQEKYLQEFLTTDRQDLFNIKKPPIWRLSTFKLDKEHICILLVFHHAILDGWSVAALLTELYTIYHELKGNPGFRPARLKSTYKECVLAQIVEKKRHRVIDFWRHELEDYKRLDFIKARDNDNDDQTAYLPRKNIYPLGEKFQLRLKQAARVYHTTIKTLCFAAFVYMLNVFSFEDDILVGLVTNVRPLTEDGDKILGCFLNTIPVRIRIPAPIKWADYIDLVDKKLLELKDNERISTKEIQSIIGERTRDENPLFDVMFNYVDFHIYDHLQQQNIYRHLQANVSYYSHAVTNTLFNFTVNNTFGDFSIIINYSNSTLSDEEVKILYDYFNNVLNRLINHPGCLALKEALISEEEKYRLLIRFNETDAAYPQDKTLHRLFAEQVERTPDHVALTGPEGETKKRRREEEKKEWESFGRISNAFGVIHLTYKELNEKSNRLAHGLIQKGMGPDTVVGIMVERSVEMIIGILGILKSSGAYLPIDPDYPQERIDYMLKDSEAKLLVTTDHISSSAFSAPSAVKNLLPAAGHRQPATSLAYIIYTSGSTGKPKGVMVEHRNVASVVTWFSRAYGVVPGVHLPQMTNYTFDASVNQVFATLISGASLHVISRGLLADRESLRNYIETHRINIINFVPGMLKELLGVGPKLRYLGIVISGAERLDNGLKESILEKGYRLYNHYGPTEATIDALACECFVGEEVHLGCPISNARIYVMDRNGHLLPIGIAGELCISGSGLARGYLNNPELTAEKFISAPASSRKPQPGGTKKGTGKKETPYSPTHPLTHSTIYRTGDLARWLPDGNIEFLGRIDYQVKIRGFRIELGEIENLLLKHDRIKDAVVVVKGNETGDKNLAAYLVSDIDLLGTELREYLLKDLPDYMIPSYFVQLEKIPLTPNGKVDRRALPKPELKVSESYMAPRNEIEKKLVEIWSDILNISHSLIGISDNFFESGGHSLRAMVLVSRIRKEFNVEFPLVNIFGEPTVQGMARFIKNTRKSIFEEIKPVEKQEYYPPSSAQKRLLFLGHVENIGFSYNMSSALNVAGKIDKPRFERAVKDVIKRHEALRTSFHLIGNEPVQRIHDEVEFEIEYYDQKLPTANCQLPTDFVRPFDFSRAPLMRVRLVTQDDHRHLLLYDMHHIIGDGTSSGLLADDFIRSYAGEKPQPLKIQYNDFSNWQNRLFASGEIKIQEEYWFNLYPGEIPRLNLLTDYPRPAFFSFAGDSFRFTLGSEDASRLKQLGFTSGTTLYMNLLAVFNVLLYKYTGQDDIIVGGVIAGRSHADLQHIIGMFVNTLAMRSHPRGDKTFREFLNEVKENSLKAFENQDVQFEELVDKLDVERDPSRNPLFDVCFAMQNVEQPQAALEEMERVEGVVFSPYEFERKISQFDLIIDAFEIADEIHFKLEYCTSLFKSETVRGFARQFVNIIREIGLEPGTRLADIDLMTEEEKRQVLVEFNDTQREYPKDKTIHQLFEEQAKQTPDRIALVGAAPRGFPDPGQYQLTYRELNEKSNRLAHYLHDERNIRAGAPVGLMMDRSVDGVIAILGILKAGGAYVPMEPSLPRERLRHMINDTGITVVVSQGKYSRLLNVLQWECPSFAAFLCIDSRDIYREEDEERSAEKELEQQVKLWEFVGETASDDITGGGWISSYTGVPLSRQEMDEYGNNILEKLAPLFHKQMRVMEIGCASGISMFRIAPRVGFYYGIDLSRTIIEKNRERVRREGHTNTALACLPAHEIESLAERNFDLVIINSVIQDFPGHNYLRRVIRSAAGLLRDRGHLFIGDVMDQDLKEKLIRDMAAFKRANRDKNYKTKTDFSMDLFVSRAFFDDLTIEIPGLRQVDFSGKIYTIENELTRYRYDVLIRVDKVSLAGKAVTSRHKYQDDTRAVEKFPVGKLSLHVPSHQLAYVLYTSGTTGVPKGVMVEHRSVVNLVHWFGQAYGLQAGVNLLQLTGYSFDPSVEDIFSTLVHGASLNVVSGALLADMAKLREFIRTQQIHIIDFIPALLEELLCGGEKPDSLRVVISGGERLEDSLKDRFLALGYRLYNHYGPTEITVDALVSECSQDKVTLGVPIANTKCFVLDRDNNPAAPGVPGELCLAGVGIARGYLNSPELTAEKFIMPSATRGSFEKPPLDPAKLLFNHHSLFTTHHSLLYRTGDLARYLPDGNIEFLGRVDHQVKIRGFRIELGEIENRLLNYPGIKEVVVLVREEKSVDKYICAYVVSDGGYSISELRESLSMGLPDYMVPSYFIPMRTIPLTSGGKVDRKALPGPEAAVSDGDADGVYVVPRDETEKKLVEIWHDVLSQPHHAIGLDDNFFQLGGHSLKAMVLVSKIDKELSVKIPLAEIFKTPSIRELAKFIKGMTRDLHVSIEPVEEKEYYALSSAQKRLYFLQQLDLNSTGYNMPMVISLRQEIKKDKLESALKRLIARHESLRTSIERVKVNEDVVQRIHPAESIEFSLDYYEAGKTGSEEIIKRFVRPFDLSRAPLIRSGLISLPDGNHVWMVDVHHIVSDGTSHTILTEDFMRLYETGVPLEPLPLQYKDFAQWQNQLFAGGRIKNQEDYWLQLYAGEIPRLNLASDYKRPGVFTFVGDSHMLKLEREDAVKFKALGARYGGTLYMNMLAALNTLFYKYTGQTDIIIGSGTAGRRHADLQGVVGMFVNTLAMRNYPAGEKPYESFLQEVIATSVKGFENQDVQFEELVEKLDPERDSSRNPLFDINMVVQNFREVDPTISLEQLRTVDENSPASEFKNPTSKFDLTFFVHEQGDDVFINIEYYTGIFTLDTIRRLVSHFKQVIKTVIEEPGIQLKEIAIISEEEMQQVLYEFNDTARDYPRDKSIPVLFAEQVEQAPDRIALVGEAPAVPRGCPVCLTYRELDEQSDRLANYLYYGNRVQPDQPVGIMMDRSLEMITAVLGILKAGGAYVPISPFYPEERIKKMINDVGIKSLLSQKRYIKTLNRLQWECGANLETFLCMDSYDVYGEEEAEENRLMSRKLWEYVGETAVDDVTGGGWNSSYTGEPIPKEEMDEYGDNIVQKLGPLLHPEMRVLEIGVASGISMYRIAPRVGLYYGTDLSGVIIEKNRRRIIEKGHKNIKLLCAAAHEIDRLDEKNFDLVIINSVIQCFHGHNYLRSVIHKVIGLVGSRGYLFIGDIMDQDLKEELIADLVRFKQAHGGTHYNTKVDWSEELFISRSFLEDLAGDYPEICDMEFSGKVHTIENELTRFRYDALIKIDRNVKERKRIKPNRRHKTCHDLRILKNFGAGKSGRWPDSHNLAYIIYTSGSTGRPKGVMVEHRGLVNYIWWAAKKYIKKGKVNFPFYSSISFDLTVTSIFTPLITGNTIVIYGAKDKELLMDKIIDDNRVGLIKLTPSHLKLIREKKIDVNSSIIKRLIVGGENFEVSLARDIYDNFGGRIEIYNEYGPTEAVVGCMIYRFDPERDNGESVSIGIPIDNIRIYILDKYLNPVPIGVLGEISIGGDGLARGYLNSYDSTCEKFVENPFIPGQKMYKTGDLARWLSDGNIQFLGRIDHQVKIRGFRIELGEIENLLLKHDRIKDTVVVVKGDETGDKNLAAYLVSDIELSDVELKEYLLKDLPDYMIPSYFVQLEKIPLTPSGKVDRKALPKPGLKVSESYTAPRDEIEKKLVKIWSDILNISHSLIGISDNFFESGGHSLRAMTLVSRIRKEFKVELPLVNIFNEPIVQEMARFIKNAQKSIFEEIKPVEKQEYYPPSSAQKRLFFLGHVENIGSSYNMSNALNVVGKIDKPRFERAVKDVIKRHEALRTSFHLIDNEPVQRIHDEVEFEIEYYHSACQLPTDFIRPFDFSRAPLMRVRLVTQDDHRHLLLYDMHHIIGDGTSSGLLAADFIRLYAGEKPQPLKIQYNDFSNWQNHLFTSGEIKVQEEYWFNLYSGEIPSLNLLTDYPRPTVFSFAGDSLGFTLGSEDVSRFKQLGLANGTTLYMNLLAAFNVLLYKYTGQDDIIVGGVVNGRRHADLQHIIGMFVNTLAMRNHPRGDKTFLEFLNEVKENSLKAFENQDLQFEELVAKLDVERDTSRNPLFDVCFVMQNFEKPQADLGEMERLKGVVFSPYAFENKISQFDLTIDAVEITGEISFKLEYCTSLFKSETVRGFARHFINIIKEIGLEPETRLSNIDLMTEEEKRQVLVEFNDTEAEYPKDKSIHRLFEEQVERTPDNIALHGCMIAWMHGEVGAITYKELNEKSNRLAGLLIEKGIQSDTIVGIMMERSVEMIIGIMGILKSGGAYLPIDPEYPQERIDYMLKDSGAKLLVTTENLEELPNFLTSQLPNFPLSSTTSLAYLIYTSGSTGKPKGVTVEHRSVVNLVHWFGQTYGLQAGVNLLQLTSYSFDPSVEDIFSTLVHGASLVVASRALLADMTKLREFIRTQRIHIIDFIPALLEELLCGGEKPDSLRVVISGGERLEDSLKDRFLALGYRLYNHYGPTEITVDALVSECSQDKVTLGVPIANTQCFVLDRDNNLAAPGVPGELCLAGAGIARGYLNSPELTAEKFDHDLWDFHDYHDDKKKENDQTYFRGAKGAILLKSPPGRRRQKIYKTGDLARFLPDGNIEFLGRIDHQVKIRGYRIELGEIEKRLKQCEGINESVVIAREDKNGDKYLCTFIVTVKEPDIPGIKEYLLNGLPSYMVPSYFLPIEKIPLTPNGKVDTKALPDISTALAGEYTAPRNEDEEKLVRAWAEVLEIEKEKICINDNFFDLGGNSLKIIRLSRELEKVLDKEIPVLILFRYSTVRALSEYINRGGLPGKVFLDADKLGEIEDSIEDTLEIFGDN
jgi:amino acid adenylation domain-containing protein